VLLWICVSRRFFSHLDRSYFNSRCCAEFKLGIALRDFHGFIHIPGKDVVVANLNFSGFIEWNDLPSFFRARKDAAFPDQGLCDPELAAFLQIADVAFAAFEKLLMAFLRPVRLMIGLVVDK